MVNLKAIPFKGNISDSSDIRPEYGGKNFLVEVTLIDGAKAYVTFKEIYEEIYNDVRADRPGGRNFMNEAFPPSRVHGEYIEWKGKKVIISIEFGWPEECS